MALEHTSCLRRSIRCACGLLVPSFPAELGLRPASQMSTISSDLQRRTDKTRSASPRARAALANPMAICGYKDATREISVQIRSKLWPCIRNKEQSVTDKQTDKQTDIFGFYI